MSHELRTPMNTIIGISDMEIERDSNTARVKDAFERINFSCKTLLSVVNDILDLSRIEAGKLELSPNLYDTASLVNDIIWLNVMRIGDMPIRFDIKISENLPAMLVGDELRIKQAINNILSNAIKYTDEGSITLKIDFKTNRSGIMLVFKVTDTGIGMTKEQVETLFDGLSVFNREANRTAEGTGLGISITKNLATMMDGGIAVESTPGKGSVFTLKLMQQRHKDDATVIGKETAKRLQDFKFSVMQKPKFKRDYMPYGSVLIVDDMNTNLFVAKGLMAPYGLKIDTALSGYECVDKIKAGTVYDIVFMDHMMPGMDGVEATQLMREHGYTHPVVALTANAIIGKESEFLKSGFDDFIAKPIDTAQLNKVLNKLIRDKQTAETLDEAKRLQESAEADEPQAKETETADPVMILRKIRDLDVDTAIEAMSGLPDLYVDTVKLTLKLLPERIEKMDKFLTEDMKSFTIEVHGLKSALKNIGAAKLGNNAARLERAGVENDQNFCEENYPPFRASLGKLAEKLNSALPEEPAEEKETADKSTLLPEIAKAKEAAESFDRDAALEIINEQIKFSFGEKEDELLRQIISALDAFDCDGALSKMNELEGI
jgi:CheY-like chemotaxis protein